MEKHKIVIVGAGPGGLMAAEEAARLKQDVLVLEKEVEHGKKVCAEGTTARALQEFPFVRECVESAHNRFRIDSFGRVAYFDEPKPFYFSLNRKQLSQYQQERAERAGAEIRRGIKVARITRNSLQTIDGQSIGFDYLIGADGPHSLVRKSLGLKTFFIGTAVNFKIPAQVTEPAFFFDTRLWAHAYAWIFPHREYVSAGTGWGMTRQAPVMVRNVKQLCHDQKLPIDRAKMEVDQINTDYRGWRLGNVYLVGEAAGTISGILGEGIYHALVAGREAARCIAWARSSSPAVNDLVRSKRAQETIMFAYYLFPPAVSWGYYSMTNWIKKRRWFYHRILKAWAY